jgi:hypothetical protein
MAKAKKLNSTSSIADVCKELFKKAGVEIVRSSTNDVLFKSGSGAVIHITRDNERSIVVQEYEDGSKRLLYVEAVDKFTSYECVQHAQERINEALGI